MNYILIVLLPFCFAEFADEMQILDKECLVEDTFKCLDESCIPKAQYCDGKLDCKDGSDEDFCDDHKPDALFCNATHQFLCQDTKQCIPREWICNDSPDCSDGSDELNCTTSLLEPANSTCHHFQCGDGKCISKLWMCDGVYDCKDKSDEEFDTCRHKFPERMRERAERKICESLMGETKLYPCVDSSFCLRPEQMCDNMTDCRDNSDEEKSYCSSWTTMCSNFTCPPKSHCIPDRYGATCYCGMYKQFDPVKGLCIDIDECKKARPMCSHHCMNADAVRKFPFRCSCDPGYGIDKAGYLCYAPEPEALLFYIIRDDTKSRDEVKYISVKSKNQIIIDTGAINVHGISFDGKHFYWVETAQGHQSILRAQLENIHDTKQIVVSIGLDDPGDIAVDYLGNNIYFTDGERGTIAACHSDGSICTILKVNAKYPRFVTLDVRNGKMYWADYHNTPLIRSAYMDGTQTETLLENLSTFATGLAMDSPNGRLYFVDKTIKVVKVDDKQVYALLEEISIHPYTLQVFENSVYWSDWISRTIQSTDKIHRDKNKRNIFIKEDSAVIEMHIYHPLLMQSTKNPCLGHNCSHMCLLSANMTRTCACPDSMELRDNTTCIHKEGYRPDYLVAAGGNLFTRIEYNLLGNPETHITHFDIGRVQAMAYDNTRDTLYLYDGMRKGVNYINMSDFNLGVTHVLLYGGLDNVVDMDYDYVSDSLYILDAGYRFVDVVSLRTHKRTTIYRFQDEVPLSFCVLPDYGIMLVAVLEAGDNEIHIDSIGLNGEDRKHVVTNDLRGPHIRIRYSSHLDKVYVSDEGNGVIDMMHPSGFSREKFREPSTNINDLAITETLSFWTDKRTPVLFWSFLSLHETTKRIRRIELPMFNNTQLHLLATRSPPHPKDHLLVHPCQNNPCSDICVQTPHKPVQPTETFKELGFKCLCPPGLLLEGNNCTLRATCKQSEFYCHRSNKCYLKSGWCDGKKDCLHGEDEEMCALSAPSTENPLSSTTVSCPERKIICNGACVDTDNCTSTTLAPVKCDATQFQCVTDKICIDRNQLCDKHPDCLDGSDESGPQCDVLACLETEFMCASGSCIMRDWRCDGMKDCSDGSDEAQCPKSVCEPDMFMCGNNICIDYRQRCDGMEDCLGGADERECTDEDAFDEIILSVINTSTCGIGEDSCELNASICIPHTARCNGQNDCPGGTDEQDCKYLCPEPERFECAQEHRCISTRLVCDGAKHCLDGSDETPDACDRLNKSSHFYGPRLYPAAECHNGYLCLTGQCLEWRQVCDNSPDCYDGTDEHGQCLTSCVNHTCVTCQPTPHGAHCTCSIGYQASNSSCIDIDECLGDPCSHLCRNTNGSFVCSCRHGYALRADKRSCKAVTGNMSILYVSSNHVHSLSSDGHDDIVFARSNIAIIEDIGVDVKRGSLYVASSDTKKLISSNGTTNDMAITNIGRPTKIAVDWVTGNVYFVDDSPRVSYVKVCNFEHLRCARLQRLSTDAKVTAFIIDPSPRKLYYCVSSELESVIWSSSLSGHNASSLLTLNDKCTGLASDYYGKIYVTSGGTVSTLETNGGYHLKTIITGDAQLESPHSPALFEDHLYLLVANTFKLSRCVLYGSKSCEHFYHRVFDAKTFVIRHQSVQRDDLKNDCEGFVCANVCVLNEDGPKCVCDNGTISNNGECPMVRQNELPLFNGWTYKDYTRNHNSSTLLVSIGMVLFALYLLVFAYYHCVYKARANQNSAYLPVRFRNRGQSPEITSIESAATSTSIIEVPTSSTVPNEFENPIGYMRNFWQQSFRRKRPVGTAGLEVNVSSPQEQQDLSDTESDLDVRENKLLVL